MTEKLKTEYKWILDKLSAEERAEFLFVHDILRFWTEHHEITIKGRKYLTCILEDPAEEKPVKMRFIHAGKGWMLCPADRSIRECIREMQG